jgi:hypothetical protein
MYQGEVGMAMALKIVKWLLIADFPAPESST